MKVLKSMPAAATVSIAAAKISTRIAGRSAGDDPCRASPSAPGTMWLFHHVQRPAFHLVIGAAEILADHADPDQLHAAQKHQQRDDGGEADLRDFDAEDAPDNKEEADGETDQGGENARVGDEPQ